MKKTALALALTAIAATSTASAQDINADPIFRTVELETGFEPDPHTVNIRSGGTIDAEKILTDCNGFISDAPDVRLRFTAGSLPLFISVDSDEDTTLVVNAPDGSWYCDDDSGNGVNPSVLFNNAMTGRYEIWIGTYGGDDYHSGVLNISELESQ